MKKIIFILFFFVTILSFGQIFEGKVIYNNTFKTKDPNYTDQQLSIKLGSKFEYSIKNGNYKNISNGTLFQWELYRNEENKIYTKFKNTEKAIWIDASLGSEEILKTEINKNTTTILGYECDELILTCKSGIHKYYYNSSVLKSDTSLFSNQNYSYWYQLLKTTNCLALKTIIETKQYTLESIVTEIIPTKLDLKTFEIPEGIQTVKRP